MFATKPVITEATYRQPSSLRFCPKTGDVQEVNGAAVVSTNRTLEGALKSASYEDRASIHFYDGLFYVTVPVAPKGYICTMNRCHC